MRLSNVGSTLEERNLALTAMVTLTRSRSQPYAGDHKSGVERRALVRLAVYVNLGGASPLDMYYNDGK